MLFTHEHAKWTQSLYARMNAATPAAKAAARVILAPRISLQT
jgi:hypothetical protein